MSAMSSASLHAASQPAAQSLSHQKHGGRHSQSLTDVDATSSSVAAAPSKTGKTGSKVDITA
jgi:hypothetical protein